MECIVGPPALREHLGQVSIHVWVPSTVAKAALAGLAEALNGTAMGMESKGVPVDVSMDHPAASRLNALLDAVEQRLQLGQKHGYPAAPDQIEAFLRPGILEHILLAQLQLIETGLAGEGIASIHVSATALQPHHPA